MRIAHIVLPGASEYEKKSQRIDFEALRGDHHVEIADHPRKIANADVTHVYGPPSRIGTLIVSPLENLPEAVAEEYFSEGGAAGKPAPTPCRIGTFARPSIRRIVEQAAARLHRTRDDVEWLLLEHPPRPADFERFDAWIDPAVEQNDFDGFVAEALVRGKPVVASRTPINSSRLEQGRIGLLTPPGDPNELTHAILAALFKTEVAQHKVDAARQMISKFLPRQRLRVLTHILETVRP